MSDDGKKEFDKVPPNITAFRFGDGGFLRFKKRGDEFHIIAKNVETENDKHLHMWFDGDKQGARITSEHERGTPNEGKPFEIMKFLETFASPIGEIMKSIERIEIDDPRFRNKKIQITTIPKIRLDRIEKRTAYFVFVTEPKELRFEEIDRQEPQIGVLRGWFGREQAIIFVAKGEIHSLSIKALKRVEKRLRRELKNNPFSG